MNAALYDKKGLKKNLYNFVRNIDFYKALCYNVDKDRLSNFCEKTETRETKIRLAAVLKNKSRSVIL